MVLTTLLMLNQLIENSRLLSSQPFILIILSFAIVPQGHTFNKGLNVNWSELNFAWHIIQPSNRVGIGVVCGVILLLSRRAEFEFHLKTKGRSRLRILTKQVQVPHTPICHQTARID